jgi:hypothetical protein
MLFKQHVILTSQETHVNLIRVGCKKKFTNRFIKKICPCLGGFKANA